MTTTLSESPSGGRLFAPARLPSFRLLWLGQVLSLLGDGFSYIAFTWITLSLTQSTLALGIVLALQAIPRALLTMVGGSLSDRFSTRALMTMSSWARAAVMTTVAVAGFAGLLNIGLLCAAAALFGAVDAFFQPARMSILPTVVDKDMLVPANALLSVGSRVAAVLGPAIGGVVVAFSDAHFAFLVDGVCFALCGLCVSRVRTLRKPAAPTAEQPTAEQRPLESMLTRIKAGIRFAVADPRIRSMVAADMAVTFCYAGAFTVGFATLAKAQPDGGATTLGLLSGSLAGGAMLGGLVGGTVSIRPRVGLMVAALTSWLAIGMLALGLLPGTVTAVATVLAMGFGIGFEGVFGLSWIQRNVDESMLSRVISFDMVLGYAVAPISLVLCGALADVRPDLMFIGAAVILGATTVGVLSSRPVREMR